MVVSDAQQTPSRLPTILLALLALEVLAAFLSDTKFVPGIRNNVGAFEAIAVIIFLVAGIWYWRHQLRIRFHPLLLVILFLVWFAALSLFHFLSPNFSGGVTQVLILLFQLLFLLVMSNLLSFNDRTLLYTFRFFAIASVIVGIWVVIDQITTGSYNASGPFRGRSHTGIYMMGAFWILLIYQSWPGLARLERLAIYPIIALGLYCVATSLRQSVYFAMIVGVIGVSIGILLATGLNRLRIVALQAVVIVPVAFLLLGANQDFAPIALFNREFNGLGAKLQNVTAVSDASEDDSENVANFTLLQREGATRAFLENPILGIGWGAFYHSDYSPTGHELHSSTWRFPAELGMVGLILYVAFLGILITRAIGLFLLARKTPYELAALIVLMGLISYAVSHYYNRMFTDRPYWWMLVIFMALEVCISRALGKQRITFSAPATAPSVAAQLDTPPMLPER